MKPTLVPLCIFFATIHCSIAAAQKPLATTPVADKVLELWAFEEAERPSMTATMGGLPGPDLGFILGDQAPEMPEIPWERERKKPGTKESFLALGFLLRDTNGKISSAGCQVSEAAQIEINGDVHSQRPFAMKTPADEYSSHKWDYKGLSPLVISTGSKTFADVSNVTRLTGFATISPRLSAEIEFTAEELKAKKRKSVGLFSIEPAGSQVVADGTVYQFEVFAPKPKEGTSRRSNADMSRKMIMMQLNATLPKFYIESDSGEEIRPGGQMRIAISRQRQARLRASIRNEIRLRNQQPRYKEMATEISFDYSLEVDVFALKIPKGNIKRILITPSVATGIPSTHQFEFTSLNLNESHSPEVVSQVIDRSRAAAATSSETHMAHSGQSGERLEISSSTTTFRTWQDASGKFSVEASFVAVNGKKVKLQKRDGSTIEVPFDRLSILDIAYIDEQKQ